MSKIVIWNESGLPDADAVAFVSEVISIGRLEGNYAPSTVFDDGYEVKGISTQKVDKFIVMKPKPTRTSEIRDGMHKARDYTGYRSGKLTALKRVEGHSDGRVVWLCACDCGGSKRVNSANLRTKSVKSCGCLPRGRVASGRNDPTDWMQEEVA